MNRYTVYNLLKTSLCLYRWKKSSNFAIRTMIYRLCYILLLIRLSLFGVVIPSDSHAIIASEENESGISYNISSHDIVGLQGCEIISMSCNGTWTSVPTQFSSSNGRVSYSKNRTRTSVIRRLLNFYQHFFTSFRGKVRRETCPICTDVGITYYVYGLRHILC